MSLFHDKSQSSMRKHDTQNHITDMHNVYIYPSGVVVQDYDPAIQAFELGGPRDGSQPGLHSKMLPQKKISSHLSVQRRLQLNFFGHLKTKFN